MAQKLPQMAQNYPQMAQKWRPDLCTFSAIFFTEKAVPQTFSLLECMVYREGTLAFAFTWRLPRRVLFKDVKRVRWCVVSSNVIKESKSSFQCWVKKDIIVENSDPRNERTDLEFSMAGYEKGMLWPWEMPTLARKQGLDQGIKITILAKTRGSLQFRRSHKLLLW